jgi:hypothetical protein
VGVLGLESKPCFLTEIVGIVVLFVWINMYRAARRAACSGGSPLGGVTRHV